MTDSQSFENDFLTSIKEIIEDNLSNEQFGVSELAHKIGMSRSNLLRKVKKSTKLSVSQFIRKVRLEQAMEILKQTTQNVSEVSFKVGFGSVSYFIKCFHDYYGFPPGEVGKRDVIEKDFAPNKHRKLKKGIIITGVILSWLIIATVVFIISKPNSIGKQKSEKSIAVLPFINDSEDATNEYFINGLMESILNNLQKIKNLRVISRTSVEKYRKTTKIIPEIGRELHVNYIVEGSGQKIGNQILLNIQLIEAKSDKHLWTEQYSREDKDIFKLQREVAKNITSGIQAIITPKEKESINKAPTDDLVAYDYFLKGLDLLNHPFPNNPKEAIPYFKKAIERDNEFARAYAAIAISYYLLDENQVEKKYSEQINHYADKALLFDSQLPQSLVAKALFYMNNEEYDLAVTYFEKALEYQPNSDLVFAFLVDLYSNYIPDTEKYLEYALKGIKIDIGAYDSITTSFIYLHISNAFIQSGFIGEAEKYINKSLEYHPENLYSMYVKAYILYAKTLNLQQLKDQLINTLKKDSTRIDILQEVGKVYYYLRDYESAYRYYKKFIDLRETQKLDVYRAEDAKIGVVLSKMGQTDESDKYFKLFKDYAENDKSIYKHINLALYYSYFGKTEKAIENLKLFSQQNHYHYWTVIFLKIDPLVDNIKDYPESKKIFKEIDTKFRKYHKKIKAALEEKEVL